MPLISPLKCWRGRSDCVSLASVESTPEGISEDDFMSLNFEPVSFVCCGCVDSSERKISRDAYRICFKNSVTDEMTDNDDQDLAHLSYVIAQAQAIIATRRIHEGRIQTLDADGSMIDVSTDPDVGGSSHA